jgi:catechol 2,3-dioxygenase-like lactoylglutathione lyase family enzyme
MSLLTGVNHIATVSKDLDSLIDFYGKIFGARVLLDVEIPEMVLRSTRGRARHVFIEVGGPSVLHAWQIEGVDPSQFENEIFNRGRVDHFALSTGTHTGFERLRRRLVAEGASTGEVNDFGLMMSFSFHDPDGLWAEVSWWKDGPDLSSLDASLMRDPIADRGNGDGE